MTGTGFIPVLLAVLAYGLVHSLLASNAAKAWAARAFGPAGRRYYRLAFSILGGVTLLPALALAYLLPDRVLWRIPAPWFYLTGLIQVAAMLGLAFGVLETGASRFLGFEQAGNPSGEEQPRPLVTGGMYGWVRHPLYFFGLLLLWLLPAMTWNRLGLAAGATIYLLAGSLWEERKLVAEFGQDYIDYRRRVPWLLPRPPRSWDADESG